MAGVPGPYSNSARQGEMENRAYALITGLFVIILGVALIGVYYWLGSYSVERRPYVITTRHSIMGLNPEAPVFYRGIEAGSVTAIQFDPNDIRTIRVRIDIDKNIPITHSAYAMLRVQILTGMAQIELDDSGEDRMPLPTSQGDPGRIPMRTSLTEKLAQSGEKILEQVLQITGRVNSLLNEENVIRVQRILASAETVAAKMVTLEDRLDAALAGLSVLSADARRTLANVDRLTRDLHTSSIQIGAFTAAAQSAAASGKALGDALTTTTLPRVNALLKDFQATVVQVGRLSRLIENDPQALLLGPQTLSPGPGEPGFKVEP
jgi:phospholipid/cholesterol/gamma-HCH transport system substrate-binding protein